VAKARVAQGTPVMAKQTHAMSHTKLRESMNAGRLPAPAGTRGRR
jgi:hypothetical protein